MSETKPISLKFRVEDVIGYGPCATVRVTIFAGRDGQTLQNAGELRLYVEEYECLSAVLALGVQTKSDMIVQHSDEILEDWAKWGRKTT